MVLIDREVPGIRADLVLVDNVLGAREATRHLLESGARRLACITGPASVSTARQRLTGFLEALAEYGVPRREAVFKHADSVRPSARRASPGPRERNARRHARLQQPDDPRRLAGA